MPRLTAFMKRPQTDSWVWQFLSFEPTKPWMKMTGFLSGRAADSWWIWTMSYLRNMAQPPSAAAARAAATVRIVSSRAGERPVRGVTIPSGSVG